MSFSTPPSFGLARTKSRRAWESIWREIFRFRSENRLCRRLTLFVRQPNHDELQHATIFRAGANQIKKSLGIHLAGDLSLRSLPLLVLEQFVLDGIHEGFPTGFDDVGVDSDRAPGVRAVGTLDDDARLGGGAARAVEDAHLVVDELHIGDLR